MFLILKMDSILYIDEREKISKLSQLLLNFDWEEAGKRFTKSYWQVQYHLENALSWSFRLGSNLMEEVVACLLGGYGLKAELGLLAFHRMKNLRLIHKGVELSEVEKAISRPFKVNGKDVHYRFPHQKAKYIYYFLQRTDLDDLEKLCGLDLRNKLMDVPESELQRVKMELPDRLYDLLPEYVRQNQTFYDLMRRFLAAKPEERFASAEEADAAIAQVHKQLTIGGMDSDYGRELQNYLSKIVNPLGPV